MQKQTIALVALFSILVLFSFCQKNNPARITKIKIIESSALSSTSILVTAEIIDLSAEPKIELGFCFSETNQEPTVNDAKSVAGSYAKSENIQFLLSELKRNTTYYVRFYITENSETIYSNTIQQKTLNLPTPVVLTKNIEFLKANLLKTNAEIISNEGSEVLASGVCWSKNSLPTITDLKTNENIASGFFNSNISGLHYGSKYYVRAYATNAYGTDYGKQIEFSTITPTLPVLTTNPASVITITGAVSGGTITNSGGLDIIKRGLCWSTSEKPTLNNNFTNNGNDLGEFTVYLSDLEIYTTYYLRAYATTELGTGYGNEISFKTASTYISDGDNNYYSTVQIGQQTWLKQNLKTTKYNDGTPIRNITNNIEWVQATQPGYCWYNNDETNKAKFGALYNWRVIEENKNVCPKGWHVPSYSEWLLLIAVLGGDNEAGGKLKATTDWELPNGGATNETGFTAFPNGLRYKSNGVFAGANKYANLWTTDQNTDMATVIYLSYLQPSAYATLALMNDGFGIRCIKD